MGERIDYNALAEKIISAVKMWNWLLVLRLRKDDMVANTVMFVCMYSGRDYEPLWCLLHTNRCMIRLGSESRC